MVPGRLVLSFQGKNLAEFPIGVGRCIVGRTSDNDLQIDSTYISRHHAQVVCTAEGVWMEDLNRKNGMYFGGKRIRRRRLADGDSVKLGLHELTYRRDAPDTGSTGSLNTVDNEEASATTDDGDELEDSEITE